MFLFKVQKKKKKKKVFMLQFVMLNTQWDLIVFS